MDINIDHIVERYIAVWNEPDPELRRSAITRLSRSGGRGATHPI